MKEKHVFIFDGSKVHECLNEFITFSVEEQN